MSPIASDAIYRTAQRYRGGGRFGQGYVSGKLHLDPIYRDLLAMQDKEFGDVVDVGCGRGQLGVLLLEAGLARSVTAMDCRDNLLAQARRAARGLTFDTEARDLARNHSLHQADTIFLIDVLYQLDKAVQRAVLTAAATVGRRVIIRTPDPGRGWRSALTIGVERAGRRVWPHAGAQVDPTPVAALSSILSGAGFVVSTAPCWRGTPFCNVLIDARKRSA